MTVPLDSVYSSSKRALLGFSLTARAELKKDRIVVSEIYPFITATNFGKNRIGNPAGGGRSISRMTGSVKWPGSQPRTSLRRSAKA
jgi:short-subunit dehydrogenase